MSGFEHWIEKSSRLFKEDIEKECLHQEYYHNEDESIEAMQWQLERKVIVEMICDEIREEILKMKLKTKLIVKVIIQAREVEAKKILEMYRKDVEELRIRTIEGISIAVQTEV